MFTLARKKNTELKLEIGKDDELEIVSIPFAEAAAKILKQEVEQQEQANQQPSGKG